MFDYDFVEVPMPNRIGPMFEAKWAQGYALVKQEIADHAKAGWRLAHIQSPNLPIYMPITSYYRLIFEKEIPGS